MDSELVNIVANAAYVRARAEDTNSARSRKWKRLLAFPPIGQTRKLEQKLQECGGLTYEAIHEEPIGKRLMKLAVAHNHEWTNMLDFIDAVHDFEELVSGDLQNKSLRDIFHQYMDTNAQFGIPMAIAFAETISINLTAETLTRDALLKVALHVNEYVSGEPFKRFMQSNYYSRFLQWKMLELRKVDEAQFRIYRPLGKGGFGIVYAGQRRETGKMYAMKFLNKRKLVKHHALKYARTERELLEKVDSLFVVSLTYAFSTPRDLCLVLNLMNSGDLKYHLVNFGAFDLVRARFYAAQITLGLQDLHALNIIYRDMKLENIMMDEKGNVRITDLGLAIQIPDGKAAKGRVGTAGYMAPEVVKEQKYGYAVDWWGLGCILYEMLYAASPFHLTDRRRRSDQEVDAHTINHTPLIDDKIDPAAADLIKQLLKKNPQDRLGSTDHGFVSNPEAVKSHPFFLDFNWAQLRVRGIEPPFTPDPYVVYARDMTDINVNDSVSSVKVTEEEETVFNEFSGVSSHAWQNDILDTVFDDLNPFTDSTLDLQEDYVPPPPTFFQRIMPCFKPPPPPEYDEQAFNTAVKFKGLRVQRKQSVFHSTSTLPSMANSKATSRSPTAQSHSIGEEDNTKLGSYRGAQDQIANSTQASITSDSQALSTLQVHVSTPIVVVASSVPGSLAESSIDMRRDSAEPKFDE